MLDQALRTLEGRAQPQDVIQIINAAEVPYIVYDPVRKMFHRSSEPRRMFGDAKVRLAVYGVHLSRRPPHLQCPRQLPLLSPALLATWLASS